MRNHNFDAFENYFIWRENRRGHYGGAKGSGASRPDQKVGQLAGTFGSTVISKPCNQKLWPEPPSPLDMALPHSGRKIY